MQSLRRVTLSVTLTIAPFLGTGCANLAFQSKSSAPPVTRREPKMDAARLEESRGNLLEAKRLYTEIHQNDIRNAECSYRLGLIYAKLNRHSEAEVFFRQAFAVNAGNPELLADMGYSAFLRKDYGQAEEFLEQSIRIKPDNRRAISNLAIVRAWLGNDDSSLATFRRVNEAAEAHRNLAAIQIARGDKVLGLKSYELARSVDATQATIANASMPLMPKEVVATIQLPPKLSADPMEIKQSDEIVSPEQIAQTDRTSISMRDTAPEVPIELSPARLSRLSHAAEPKFELQGTCIRLVAAIAQLPAPVTAVGIPIQSSNQSRADENLGPDSIPSNSAIDNESGNESVVDLTQEMTFEIPTRRSSQKPNSDLVIEMSDIQDVCLVTLSEGGRFEKGLPEFALDYHSQQYRFSSAEALEKFRVNPEQYAPAAGGLDVVHFRNEREVIPGSLNFGTWYRRRLYLFASRESADAFQRNPPKYVATE